MGKVIIDVQMLGMNFMQVIFREAAELATEKGLDSEKISKELAEAQRKKTLWKLLRKILGMNS